MAGEANMNSRQHEIQPIDTQERATQHSIPAYNQYKYTQPNAIQDNNTEHIKIRHNDTQYTYILYNNTQQFDI